MKLKSHNAIPQPCEQATQKYSKIVTRKGKAIENGKFNKTKKSAQLIDPADKENSVFGTVFPPTKNTSLDGQIKDKCDDIASKLANIGQNKADPLLAQYQAQIIKYIKKSQSNFVVKSNYIRSCQNITHQHRATFVKHFFKVAKKFQLKRNTIFLAVYYMDSYFEKTPQIQKRQAIIAAQACLFMATKYEQIYPPELYQWTQATKQIIQMESQILKTLDFNLAYHSLQNYLQLYFSKLELPQRDIDMVRLVADVSLFDQSLSMYNFGTAEYATAILYSIVNRSKMAEKMEMAIKWMMQRNQTYLQWLQTIHYTHKRS